MAAKSKKQEKAPKSCQECEHWTEVRNKLRVGDVLTAVVKKMEGKINGRRIQAFAGRLSEVSAVGERDRRRRAKGDQGYMGRTGQTKHRDISYDPLPSQKKFHALENRFKGFSGPIGSGKSQALCQEAIRLSYMNPGRLGLLGAPTYPMLRDATQAALVEILESNEIPYEHNKAENTFVMLDTRSRILFRPVDEFERLRGTNLAWFGLDELTYTQEESWLRLEGRLRDPRATRLCGFAVWTPKGYDWVYRKFISDPVNGYAAVQAEPFENRHLLSKIGDFYERLKDSYDEKFYQQEVLGSYLSMDGGRVYSAFDRNYARTGSEGRSARTAVVDVGFQRGPDEFVDRTAGARDSARGRGDRDPARDDEAGVRGVSQAISETRCRGRGLRRRIGIPAADDGRDGLRHDSRALRGAREHESGIPGSEGQIRACGSGST